MEVQRLLKSRRKVLQWEPGPGAPPARPGGQAGEELAPRPCSRNTGQRTPAVPPGPRPGKGGTSWRGPRAQAWKAAGSRALLGGCGPPGRAREPNRRGLVGRRARGPAPGGKRRPLPRSPPPGGADSTVGSLSPISEHLALLSSCLTMAGEAGTHLHVNT